jgi:hypothetical protein
MEVDSHDLVRKRQCKHIIDEYGFCFSTNAERPRPHPRIVALV